MTTEYYRACYKKIIISFSWFKFKTISSSFNSNCLRFCYNPILNDPDCYNDPCHAHNKDDEILGIIGINIPLYDLDKSAADTRNKILIFSGILIILSTIALGRIIRNQIQRPISKLTDGMHQVADLHLDYTLDVNSTEDIRDMAITFNKMTQKLKGAQQEIQEWSNTLEDKVKEKTKELESAQRQLPNWVI
ncbi:MAG: HAMP domain-containing protein [Candidatus Hodarchaeota archaeon]